ncbi:hypothetical protein DZF84_13900, partial [Vibrio parahaemolyticus]|nr:hypothetical protein [Vibrio parahaemolyticus]
MFNKYISLFVLMIFLAPLSSLASQDSNFNACLYGNNYACNESLLTKEQAKRVHTKALERNFNACLYGNNYACNESLLTKEQAKRVQAKALERNFNACLY